MDGHKEREEELVGVSGRERPRGVVLLAPFSVETLHSYYTSLDSCNSSRQFGLSLPLPVRLECAVKLLARFMKSG